MAITYDDGFELQEHYKQTKKDMVGAIILECSHNRWYTQMKIKHTDGSVEDVIYSADSFYTQDADGIAVLRR